MNELQLLGAIRYNHGPDVDPALDEFVQHLRALDVSIVGYLQRQLPDVGSCCPISHLEDLASGEQSRITQPLGSGSTGCRLDPGALANASEALSRQMGSKPDILILNRFGRGESEGRGFRPVIEQAVELGIPVLTAVKERYAAEWETFSDGMATYLPADTNQIMAWAMPILSKSAAHQNTELSA
ncbi:MAG: DUF2478 domain-containing protein [Roseibium sp.]